MIRFVLFLFCYDKNMLTTQQVAEQYVALANEGKYEEIQSALYADDAMSIEPDGKVVQGREALAKKGEQRNAMMEKFVSGWCSSDFVVAGEFFSCAMGFEAVMKGKTEPEKFEEVCVFQVKNGKIVKEQFFYEE